MEIAGDIAAETRVRIPLARGGSIVNILLGVRNMMTADAVTEERVLV